MEFIQNHLMDLFYLTGLLYIGYQIWYDYFAKVNKFGDEQLIVRYTIAHRKGLVKYE